MQGIKGTDTIRNKNTTAQERETISYLSLSTPVLPDPSGLELILRGLRAGLRGDHTLISHFELVFLQD